MGAAAPVNAETAWNALYVDTKEAQDVLRRLNTSTTRTLSQSSLTTSMKNDMRATSHRGHDDGTDVVLKSLFGAKRRRTGDDEGGHDAKQKTSEELVSVAREAIQAIKKRSKFGSGADNDGNVEEVRKFAGEDIVVPKKEEKQGKANEPGTQRKVNGLDSVLESLKPVAKINTLDKSRADWDNFKETKATDEDVQDLEKHKKSNDTYLEKVEFLQRSEVREYEKERDEKLKSTVRR